MNIAFGVYALLLFIGGVIGYFMAGSTASLIMGSSFAALFSLLAVYKGRLTSYIGFGMLLVLFAFFSYRFIITFKVMPAGIMSLVSLGLLVKLARELCASACCKSDTYKCNTPSDHKTL